MKSNIWHKSYTHEELEQRLLGTMAGHLSIKIVEIGDDFLKGSMPVTEKNLQPIGLVHGGANVVLAETLGSAAANMVVDRDKFFCVGQEVNANHVRSVREGNVTGVARLDYEGKTSQVWTIKLYDDKDRVTCVSRLTMAVLSRR